MQKASCTQKPSAPLLQKESARVISKGGIATGIHVYMTYIYIYTHRYWAEREQFNTRFAITRLSDTWNSSIKKTCRY